MGDIETIIELGIGLVNFINNISEKEIKYLINYNNGFKNFRKYDIINKVLIINQVGISKAKRLDLRTEQEWLENNRYLDNVDKNKKYILYLSEDFKYINSETGEEVINSDLNIKELKKAVELGIVEKRVNSNRVGVVRVYNKEETKGESIENLIEGTSKDLSTCIKEADSILKEIDIDNKDFIRHYVSYGIGTYFNVNIDRGIKNYNVYNDEILYYLSVIDVIVKSVLRLNENEFNYEIEKKADMVYKILEMFKIRKEF